MNEIIDYIIAEKEWIFSGVGVFILSIFLYRKSKSSKRFKQKVSKDSKGIQAGGDVNINTPKK
jgi:hypothetical protein|tara:strand:+ start:188 stop:376 length:189 start_codon:yes stop_codon:yes gene_type:complete